MAQKGHHLHYPMHDVSRADRTHPNLSWPKCDNTTNTTVHSSHWIHQIRKTHVSKLNQAIQKGWRVKSEHAKKLEQIKIVQQKGGGEGLLFFSFCLWESKLPPPLSACWAFSLAPWSFIFKTVCDHFQSGLININWGYFLTCRSNTDHSRPCSNKISPKSKSTMFEQNFPPTQKCETLSYRSPQGCTACQAQKGRRTELDGG